MSAFYGSLAPWWPVVSPLTDYEEEAAEVLRVLRTVHPGARTLLELGSGGGHVAHYLAPHYACCLTDISPDMLSLSWDLNPGCEHVVGDMRTLDLARTFDIVFVHDAVDYLTTEEELARVAETAWRHLAPGGVVVLLPDTIAETFAPGADVSGGDAADGRAARLLEWTEPLRPGATAVTVHYAFLLKDADGHTRCTAEQHTCGVFPEATWRATLAARGFEVQVLDEQATDDRVPRRFFAGRKPGAEQ